MENVKIRPCTLSFISTLLIRRIPRIFHFVFHKTEIKIDRKFNTVPIFWNNLIQWIGISLWNWQIIFINSNHSLRNTICTSLKLNTLWYTYKFFWCYICIRVELIEKVTNWNVLRISQLFFLKQKQKLIESSMLHGNSGTV